MTDKIFIAVLVLMVGLYFYSKEEMPNKEPKNLLINGDFEEELKGWVYKSDVYWSANEGASLLLNPPEITRDKGSRIINAKNASQCVNINETSIYELEVSFRYADNFPVRPSVNRLHLYWYDGLDCNQGGQYGGYLEPKFEKNVWQKMRKQDLKPSLGARSAQIRLEQRQDGNNNAKAFWDNVVFTETSHSKNVDFSMSERSKFTRQVGENYIQNPNFDENIDRWNSRRSKSRAWRSIDNDGVMAETIVNKRDSSMGTVGIHQCVNFGSEERFELGAKVKADPNSSQRGGGRLRATWYEEVNCKGRNRGARHHADVDKSLTGWQQLHVSDLVPSAGSTSVSIGTTHSIEGRGENTLLWDDFYFRSY